MSDPAFWIFWTRPSPLALDWEPWPCEVAGDRLRCTHGDQVLLDMPLADAELARTLPAIRWAVVRLTKAAA